jgi:drug/metabolite transporter (DMT)-like permease
MYAPILIVSKGFVPKKTFGCAKPQGDRRFGRQKKRVFPAIFIFCNTYQNLNSPFSQFIGYMTSDKMVNGIGALLVILGIVIILTPWVIFPVCEHYGSYMMTSSGMQVPMACGWTARAESGIGALIVVAGGLLIARSTPETRQATGVFTIALGALVILIPTVLIGMCKTAEHPCRVLTLPALEILGIIVILVGGYLVMKRE